MRGRRILPIPANQLGSLLVLGSVERKLRAYTVTFHPYYLRVSRLIYEYYCIAPVGTRRLTEQKDFRTFSDFKRKLLFLQIMYLLLSSIRKRKVIVSPVIPKPVKSIKFVKGVSCVDQLSFVQNVKNVPVVAPDLPVGARLQQFWEKWAALGPSPKVLIIVREGYTLPFWI